MEEAPENPPPGIILRAPLLALLVQCLRPPWGSACFTVDTCPYVSPEACGIVRVSHVNVDLGSEVDSPLRCSLGLSVGHGPEVDFLGPCPQVQVEGVMSTVTWLSYRQHAWTDTSGVKFRPHQNHHNYHNGSDRWLARW